jgi:polysaccharide export outer membrane protein
VPAYVIEPPDVLLVEYACPYNDDPVRLAGQRLVRPDGTIGLGQLGAVAVGGLTVEQARRAVAPHLASRLDDFDPKRLRVDVLAYNSKAYYVITEGADGGEQIHRFPATGNDTVVDVISQVPGLRAEALKKKVWIDRQPDAPGGRNRLLAVSWKAILQRGQTDTNYVLLPGDRLYVKSQGFGFPGANKDPGWEFEFEVLKAWRAAGTPEEKRRVVEALESLAKELRGNLKEPDR